MFPIFKHFYKKYIEYKMYFVITYNLHKNIKKV